MLAPCVSNPVLVAQPGPLLLVLFISSFTRGVSLAWELGVMLGRLLLSVVLLAMYASLADSACV